MSHHNNANQTNIFLPSNWSIRSIRKKLHFSSSFSFLEQPSHTTTMGDTDDYTRGVLGSAPKKSNRMEVDDMNARQLGDGLLGGSSARYQNNCSRAFVFLLSTLLTCAGIALIVYAMLVKTNRDPLPMCVRCEKWSMYGALLGGAIGLVGILGFISACSRNKCVTFPYALLVLILSLAMFAAGGAVIYYATGTNKFSMLPEWEAAVKDAPEDVCALQKRLQCSGYQLGCCAVNGTSNSTGNTTTTSTVPPKLSRHVMRILDLPMPLLGDGVPACYNVTVAKDICPVCTAPSDNDSTEMCDVKLHDEAKKYFIPAAAITFGSGVIALIEVICLIRMVSRG